MVHLPGNKMLLCACTCLALMLSLHTTLTPVSAAPSLWNEDSAPSSQSDLKSQQYLNLLQEMLHRLRSYRAKRTRADGGFFSRHDAMSDYLNSAYASSLASDLYGPGKR